MPLDVTLVGPDGELIDRVVKSQPGEFKHDLTGPIGLTGLPA
jgi:hypothetical protein